MIGKTIGQYEVVDRVGEGGMATVYLARDSRHDRQVAIKVLNSELAETIGAERFLLEIETAANLTHPHILPLHDSGKIDGHLFYVMPYVEGESLRIRLDRETQLPVDDAIRITREVADGLNYAHGQGVIHRDIKPENILLSDGHALIADFGIARAVSVAGGARLTETGLHLGTPPYMSPEQATGELEIDARSDIYALACVTYEMLAGHPPHTGPNAQAIIAKVLTEPARSLQEIRKTVSPGMDHAVGRALERLPADRWTTARQYAEALIEVPRSTGFPATSSLEAVRPIDAGTGWRDVTGRMVVGAMLIAGLSIGLGWLLGVRSNSRADSAEVTRFPLPARGGIPGGQYHRLAVSPDGRVVAYVSREGMMLRRLDQEEPELVPDIGGGTSPIFSPDGTRLGFGRGLTFHQVLVSDGSLVGSTDVEGLLNYGATWKDDDTIIFVGMDMQLWEIPVYGGETTQVTVFADSTYEISHVWPQAFDEGRMVVYTILGPSGLWHDASVVVQNIRTGERTTIAEEATFGRYLPTGHILYTTADATLHATPYDLSREVVTGPSFPVHTGIRVGYWGGVTSYAVSETGTFVFIRGSNWELHQLIWLDRRGRHISTVGSPVTAESVQLSPDGRKIALYLAQPGNADIYTIDAQTGDQLRVTYEASTEDWPVWSPDSRWLAYQSAKSGLDHRIEVQELGSVEGPRTIFSASPTWLWPSSWSPDGQWLAFTWPQIAGPFDIYVVQVDSTDHLVPIATTSADETGAQFSPNGRWLAYQSNETGRTEVYVVMFPEKGIERQISFGGGGYPRWSTTGDELFYRRGYTIMAVPVTMTADEFHAEPAQPLFEYAGMFGNYSVTPDAERFLVMVDNPESTAEEFNVVLNWFKVLKEKAER